MPVCGSVGGGGASGIGMGYHGNVLLKTNVGEGEAEVESLIWWERGGGGVGRESHRRDSTLYQRHLSSPRVGWMRSSVGAWWGRENCRTWCLEGGNVSKVSPGIDW